MTKRTRLSSRYTRKIEKLSSVTVIKRTQEVRQSGVRYIFIYEVVKNVPCATIATRDLIP